MTRFRSIVVLALLIVSFVAVNAQDAKFRCVKGENHCRELMGGDMGGVGPTEGAVLPRLRRRRTGLSMPGGTSMPGGSFMPGGSSTPGGNSNSMPAIELMPSGLLSVNGCGGGARGNE